MGPSGSGKSTTLLHIVGVYRARRGGVDVMGVDVGRQGVEELRSLRRKVGFLFQGAALIGWLSVYDNVALPLRETMQIPKDEIRERVHKALQLVRLWPDHNKYPSELSGGMRKRAGLARAIITNPEIILYDEPTAGLDPAMSAQIEQLIRNLRETVGVTSVLVTHDVQCASTCGSRIGILSEGRLQAEGGPDLLRSEEPAVLRFLGKAVAAGEAT